MADLGDLLIRPMEQTEAEEIAAWHYDGEYAFYDATADPDDLAELLEPARRGARYFSALDASGRLVGFFCFDREGGITELGLGMRPDLTGKGFGLGFLEQGLQLARQQAPDLSFHLTVAAFNHRAIRLYEKAGFRRVRELVNTTNGGSYDFVEMARKA